ncbi:MAG: DNA starvation/stationary phase protection protein [Lactimicrobium sp.]|uniref:Dps family protein n=1 Tax=Lactimicrobium sp. TaxID=2563780 RepID=UPI002F36109C
MNTIEKLNTLLASQEVFASNLQTYHWYIKGKQFFTLHPQLEDLYDAMRDDFDETAELILMLSGAPVAALSDFVRLSSIKEASSAYMSDDEVLSEVKKGYEELIKQVLSLKKESDSELVSIKLDDMLTSYAKNVWMISQASR